jgi:hypothetical protein
MKQFVLLAILLALFAVPASASHPKAKHPKAIHPENPYLKHPNHKAHRGHHKQI